MHLKVPPPVALFVAAALVFLSGKLFPATQVSFPGQNVLGILLIVAVVAIGGHALSSLYQAATTFNPTRPDKSSALVTSGLFRLSRNPIYVADVLFLIALGSLFGALTALIIIPAFMWYLTEFQIKPEEEHLARNFGKSYLDYKSRVRRWI